MEYTSLFSENKRSDRVTKRKSFWHFVRYNPISLFGYWLKHMRRPTEEFWLMMAWNSPYFDHLMKEPCDDE